MRKIFDPASKVHVAALLCCGTAVLVSGCGGSSGTDGDTENRTLAVTLSSIDAPAAAAPAPAPGIAGARLGPAVRFSPQVLDFGFVATGKTSAIHIVTITNTGDADLSFPVDFRVQDSRFAFGGAGNCKRNVNYAPGASCTASLTYTPTSTSAVSGNMTVATNDSNMPWVLPLKAGPGSLDAAPNNLYVATTGSDANAGTRGAPFKTISKAATAAKAGYVVHVADGTYRENVITNSSGTASSYITYISDNRWGAKIVAPGGGNSAAWHNRGDFVAIVGFDISGGGAVGINHSGSGDIARQNHVHHIPAAACSGYGGGGHRL